MQTVLLTGATGFLGGQLARALCAQGHKLRALRRTTSSLIRLHGIEHAIEWLDTDTADKDVFDQFFNDVDVVIHTAATYGRSGQATVDIVQTNLLYALKVLEAATRRQVGLFLNTDSALPTATNAYSLSKAQFAQWGRFHAARSQTRFLNVRLEHMYGPDDDDVKFIDHLISACLRNQPVVALTAGTQQRDFIYIADVVAAYMLLLSKQPSFIDQYADVSLGSGSVVSIRTLAELIHRETQSASTLDFGAILTKPGEVMYSCADIDALARLGWQPHIALEQGVRLTIESKRI